MYAFDVSFQHELARTTWIFYSIGMAIIVLRMYSQIHRLGIKGLKLDDCLMLLAAVLYTILVVCLNIIAQGGGSNLFEPDELSTFTPEDIKDRIYGSKIVIVSEQAMLNLIYLLKVCIILMYRRITVGTKQGRMLKYLGGYVAIGWMATEIAFFTACRPFKGYWAVPPPDPQCTTLAHYAIVQACFNISSDLMMILIPLPMIASLQLPLKQKIMLGFIFSMGFFVITAAILTKVFNLSNVYDTAYMLWYTREASVAVYVANLPMIWPLLREWIPYLRTGLTRSNDSDLPRYASRSGGPTGSSKRRSSVMPAFDDLETTIGADDRAKEASLDTLSERPTNASDNAISPVASVFPAEKQPLPARAAATTTTTTTAPAADVDSPPEVEKLSFGFSSRPGSWGLESMTGAPRSKNAPAGFGGIHAETTIEVETAMGGTDGKRERTAAFDPSTVPRSARVRIEGGTNELRRTPSQR